MAWLLPIITLACFIITYYVINSHYYLLLTVELADESVQAVPYSYPVHRSLRTYAWQGATLSLFPARQRYSYHTSQLRHLKAT